MLLKLSLVSHKEPEKSRDCVVNSNQVLFVGPHYAEGPETEHIKAEINFRHGCIYVKEPAETVADDFGFVPITATRYPVIPGTDQRMTDENGEPVPGIDETIFVNPDMVEFFYLRPDEEDEIEVCCEGDFRVTSKGISLEELKALVEKESPA